MVVSGPRPPPGLQCLRRLRVGLGFQVAGPGGRTRPGPARTASVSVWPMIPSPWPKRPSDRRRCRVLHRPEPRAGGRMGDSDRVRVPTPQARASENLKSGCATAGPHRDWHGPGPAVQWRRGDFELPVKWAPRRRGSDPQVGTERESEEPETRKAAAARGGATAGARRGQRRTGPVTPPGRADTGAGGDPEAVTAGGQRWKCCQRFGPGHRDRGRRRSVAGDSDGDAVTRPGRPGPPGTSCQCRT